MDAWGLRCSPHALPCRAPAQAPSLLRARGCPAPQTAVPRSPRRPPASVGSGLRVRRAPVTSPAPWTAHPAPVSPGGRRPRDPVLPAQCSRCPLSGCHPPALHPFSSSLGGFCFAAGRKLSSPPRLHWVLLLLFVTVPSHGELGHLGQVFLGGSAEVKEALGHLDSAAARVQSPRLGRWTPAASPPLRLSGPDTCEPPTDAAPPRPPHVLPLHGHSHPIGWTPGARGS